MPNINSLNPYICKVEELLDEGGEAKIKHSQRIGLILIVSCLATLTFIVSGEVGLFDYFDSKLVIIILLLSIPLLTAFTAVVFAYPANENQVKQLDHWKALSYSVLPFGFIFVIICFLIIDVIKTPRLTLNEFIEIFSVCILIGCIPSSIIFSIIKARSLYLLNKAWVYIIPLCIVIVAALSIGLYFIVQTLKA